MSPYNLQNSVFFVGSSRTGILLNPKLGSLQTQDPCKSEYVIIFELDGDSCESRVVSPILTEYSSGILFWSFRIDHGIPICSVTDWLGFNLRRGFVDSHRRETPKKRTWRNRINLTVGVCKKKPKPKTEPKNRRNRTEKSVNRKKFPKRSVRLTEPEKNFGFRFGYGSGGSKIWLTGG